MSAPFGTRSFGMSLSRALRRAQRRILRRGAVQETTHLTRADHSWKLEALEPRVLMSADPFTVALGASAGQVELRFDQTGANRALTVDYSDRADEFYDISDNNMIDITGSSDADRIKLTFGDGFDDTGLALWVFGLGGVDTVTIDRLGTLSLGDLTVLSESISVGATASTGALGIAGAFSLTADSVISGGTTQIILTDSVSVGGDTVIAAQSVQGASGDATAQITLSGAIMGTGSVSVTASVLRDFTDTAIGIDVYDLGTATASINVGNSVVINGSDVTVGATISGNVVAAANLGVGGGDRCLSQLTQICADRRHRCGLDQPWRVPDPRDGRSDRRRRRYGALSDGRYFGLERGSSLCHGAGCGRNARRTLGRGGVGRR